MLLLVNSATAAQYFVLDVNYLFGSVTFNSVSLREIENPALSIDKSGFLIKTVSFADTDIGKVYYNMAENKNYIIYIAYNKKASRIEVYNLQNSKIMDIDVGSFSDTCGDSECQPHESYKSCELDCASGGKDDFCDGILDKICDPDCTSKADSDCSQNSDNKAIVTPPVNKDEEIPNQEGNEPAADALSSDLFSNYMLWTGLGAAIAGIVVFILIRNRRENHAIAAVRQYINENLRRGFSIDQIKQALFRQGYNEKEVKEAMRSA